MMYTCDLYNNKKTIKIENAMRLFEGLWRSMDCLSNLCFLILIVYTFRFSFCNLIHYLEHD